MADVGIQQVLEQLSRDGQLEWQLAVQRATIAALEAELAAATNGHVTPPVVDGFTPAVDDDG